MLIPPNCFIRKCKHYLGITQSDGTEKTEKNYCKAFPKGIPKEIAYGDNEHLVPLKGQGNEIVYVKKSKGSN